MYMGITGKARDYIEFCLPKQLCGVCQEPMDNTVICAMLLRIKQNQTESQFAWLTLKWAVSLRGVMSWLGTSGANVSVMCVTSERVTVGVLNQFSPFIRQDMGISAKADCWHGKGLETNGGRQNAQPSPPGKKIIAHFTMTLNCSYSHKTLAAQCNQFVRLLTRPRLGAVAQLALGHCSTTWVLARVRWRASKASPLFHASCAELQKPSGKESDAKQE